MPLEASSWMVSTAETTAPRPTASKYQTQLPQMNFLRLKDDKGHFKSEAVTCVVLLVGECEVAPSRCGAVIQAVASHVFHATVPN